MMNKQVPYIKINQPIGTMYLVKLPAAIVAEISATQTRKSYNDNYVKGYQGIQRRLEIERVSAIANFCKKEDAMFPTPIILSAPSDRFRINETTQTITIPNGGVYCSIIDGQHRIEGIKSSGFIDKFELFVEFIFDTDPARDAYLFSIINGNQKPVSKSLIYDLFGVSKARTVEKLCNKVMRELNTNINSEMAGKIKMLGYKDEFSPDGVVSQARLIDELIKHITDDSNRDNYDIEVGNFLKTLSPKRFIFREWFINREDDRIIDESIRFFNTWLKSIEKFKKRSKLEKSVLEKSLGFSSAYRLYTILYKGSNDYEQNLELIIKEFFEKNLEQKTFSSSESGIVDLLYCLVKLGINVGVFREDFLEEYFNEKQLNKIARTQLQ